MRQKTEMLHFRVTPQELERIRQKKAELASGIWVPIFAKWQWTDTV